MATTYTNSETDSRSFVGVQILLPGTPSKIYWFRLFYSYDTSSLSGKSPLLMQHKVYVITYRAPLTPVKMSMKHDVIGTSLTDPSMGTIFDGFAPGALCYFYFNITSSGWYTLEKNGSAINTTGNTDISMASTEEGFGPASNANTEGISMSEAINQDNIPQLNVYAVTPSTPSVINTPTSINQPSTINTPSASYNNNYNPRIDGGIKADVDINDPPTPTE